MTFAELPKTLAAAWCISLICLSRRRFDGVVMISAHFLACPFNKIRFLATHVRSRWLLRTLVRRGARIIIDPD